MYLKPRRAKGLTPERESAPPPGRGRARAHERVTRAREAEVQSPDRAAWLAERRAAKEAEREERRRAWREKHDAEIEERRLARERSREQRRLSAHPNDFSHADTLFEEEMASRLNISVAEFRRRQADNRAAIEDKPAISYSPDHTVH